MKIKLIGRDWERDASEILALHKNDDLDEEEEENAIEKPEEVHVSVAKAQHIMTKMRKLALVTGRTSLLNKVMDIDSELLLEIFLNQLNHELYICYM